jgi:hypothetical protein
MHNQTVGPDCGRCHTTRSWIIENITEVHQKSRFPLVGPHFTAQCSQCHPSASQLRWEPQGVLCYDCHAKDYNSTTSPKHAENNYSKNCTDCHSMNSFTWTSMNVDHNFFPLTQGHAVDCKQCHTSGSFSKLPTECSACHLPNYNATTNPNHGSIQIPQTCADCHTTMPGWKPATFAIHGNYYMIEGAHTSASCVACHNGNYNSTPKTCAGCHQTDYNQTNNPPHITSSFSTECLDCHNQTAWIPWTVDHDSKYFPIRTGKHTGIQCTECHTNPANYGSFSCIDCHEHIQSKSDPEHTGVQGYQFSSPACYACHPTGEKNGSFNHSNSGFPLTGAHLTTPCLQCHVTSFSGTPKECMACHLPNYNASVNPSHSTLNFPKTCADCHTTNPGWKPATFAIHSNYYPLTGAHTSVSCANCHNGNYTNTPNTCVGCHQANYTATTNPNHVAINIPNTCANCHTTVPGWKPATFPIHNNYYVIQGAHTSVSCAQCHNGNYNSTPNTCYGCHQTNYNQAANPNHVTAGFPTTCADCHNQNAWVPSTFNHDGNWFPIYSGKHKGEWSSCTDCHPNAGNFQVFTCTTACHPQSQTNNDHQGVPGYSYNSQACYNCHPTGSGGKLVRPPQPFKSKE